MVHLMECRFLEMHPRREAELQARARALAHPVPSHLPSRVEMASRL
jgi:hypothetical protein